MSLKSRIDEMIAGELVTPEEFNSLFDLQFEARLGKFYERLDDGFIRLVDHMGGDAAIFQTARVSYGKGTKKKSDDRGLIRYLMRHRHTTPFEMVGFKFHVRVPMDCWRQWIRHRTASVPASCIRCSVATCSVVRFADAVQTPRRRVAD